MCSSPWAGGGQLLGRPYLRPCSIDAHSGDLKAHHNATAGRSQLYLFVVTVIVDRHLQNHTKYGECPWSTNQSTSGLA
jgi:hypothetical protein